VNSSCRSATPRKAKRPTDTTRERVVASRAPRKLADSNTSRSTERLIARNAADFVDRRADDGEIKIKLLAVNAARRASFFDQDETGGGRFCLAVMRQQIASASAP